MSPYAGWAYGCGWMWLLPVAFFLLIAVVAFRGLPCCPRSDNAHDKNVETAQKILDRRYASGEIAREEYQAIKKDLGG